MLKEYFSFCRAWKIDCNHAKKVASEFNAARRGGGEHERALCTIKAVWGVNRLRGDVTDQMFDIAVWRDAMVLPLLRACRKHVFLDKELVPATGPCDITGEVVPNRWRLIVGDCEQCVRSDVARVVVAFHLLFWYPNYACSLPHLDTDRETARFHAALRQVKLTNERVANAGTRTDGSRCPSVPKSVVSRVPALAP